jgi:hypothetical protein
MSHLDESLLNEYLDEVLDQPTRGAVEAHLDACPDCRARLDDLRMVFYSLSLLDEKPLAHDLTSGIIDRLPAAALSPGWKLVLTLQAGVAMGLLGAIGQAVLGLLRPVMDGRPLVSAWMGLMSRVSFHMPVVTIRPLDLSGYSLPFSTPVTIVLLITVMILLWLGNTRLLRNGYEA